MEVVVEYDYDALHDDELTLRPGDVIKNVRHIEEDGWMEGELHGRRGLFPDNFVKEVKKEVKEVKEESTSLSASVRRERSSGTVANLVQRMSTIGLPTGAYPPPPPAASKKPKRRQCKVLFDYKPANEDELELKVGDTIDIIEEVEEGWWNGSMNGRSGLFPSNFVKELEADESDSNDAAADESSKDEKDGVVPEPLLSPTSPSPTAGNGSIAQPKKVRGIGFGDIFKEGSVKLKARLPSPDTEDRKDKPIPSLPSAAKPPPANVSELQRLDGDVKVKAKECCKVTFPFEATSEDELTLRVDDIIFLISKDTGEPGWWRGENAGREGVFPDNFVTVISDTERETHVSRGSMKASLKQEQQQEEKPKKPPPPSKTTALKPEVPSADRKPHYRTEDRDRPSKPATPPVVPPKKPVPPPGKGRPGGVPPKRPDKPLTHSPNLRHNGEAPPTRPKSDLEPSVPVKPKTLSGDWGEKTPDTDLMSFDDLSTSSEKLSHPTANRPKMPGRRLPAHFTGGPSPHNDINADKWLKAGGDDDDDDEEAAKLKPSDTRKPTTHTFSSSPPFHKPPAEARPGPAVSHSLDLGGSAQGTRARPEPQDSTPQLEELRAQMKDLLMSVDLMKTQQQKEMADLRGALDAEIQKRVSLQLEVETLKRSIHST